MRDATTSGEALLVALILAAGVAIGAVWVGATFSAIAFGAHTTLGVGLRAAAVALPRVVRRAGEPSAAWPPPANRRLPGPVAYWACTAAAAGGALTAAGFIAATVQRHRRVGPERRRRMGLEPDARFARPSDLVPMWVPGPTPNRVILGRVGRRLVATEDRLEPNRVPWWRRRQARARAGDRGAVVVLGPTRCGKTTALAVPAILEWQGPVVALSVKSDLMGSTLAARQAVGEVRVFDPADATTQRSCAWSPLRGSQTLSGAKKAARAVANATDWAAKGSGDMAFWVSGAEDLLAPLFLLAASNQLGMDAVVKWVLTVDRPDPATGAESTVSSLVNSMCAKEDEALAQDGEGARQLLWATWSLDFKQLSSVYVTAKAMISPWQDPVVAESSVGRSVDLDWLLGAASDSEGTARTRANTLYLCAPLHEAHRLAPVLGGLLGDLFDQAYERVGKDNTPIRPVLVVVDEAGNWPLTNLPAIASTCAGIGIQLVLVYQSKAQIDAAYGRQADTVISNCLTKVFFAGLSDESTLRYAEGLLGAEHVVSRQASVDGGGRRSTTESATRVELLPMAMLRQVRPGEALLVHNTLPPAHLIGRYWFRDPRLKALANTSPAEESAA